MSSKKYLLIHGIFTDAFYRKLKQGKDIAGIFVLEGRPMLEGAKQVCRRLLAHKITPTLICDNMAGFCFYQEKVKEVHLAWQGIKGGSAVCKIGSLALAVCAKYHKVPVYLHPARKKIKSRCRPRDVFYFAGRRVAPAGIKAYTALIEDVSLKYITGVQKDEK